jgi:hypothetical protein
MNESDELPLEQAQAPMDAETAGRAIENGWEPGDSLRDAEIKANARPGGLLALAGVPPPDVDLRGISGLGGGKGELEGGERPVSGDGASGIVARASDPETRPGELAVLGASVRAGLRVRTAKDNIGAKGAYGETSGLYAQKKDPQGSIYDPANWDSASQADLQEARRWIAEVQRRNPTMNYDRPQGNNPIEARQWKLASDAAGKSDIASPSTVKKFFIRQEGVGPQLPPDSWKGWVLHKSFGPFVNVGGGDVPKGNGSYIEFYRKGP